jgi:hypothetical protein
MAPQDLDGGLPAALPGASLDPGSGPVVDALVETLLDDGAALLPGADLAAVLAAHRAGRNDWYDPLLGPVLLPTGSLPALADALRPADHALRVVLVAAPDEPDPLAALRADSAQLMDADRLEPVGVQLTLPDGDPGRAARAVLDALAFTIPACLDLPLRPGWEQALAVLAEDGAERAALRPTGWTDDDLARVLRRAIDLDVPVTVPTGIDRLVRDDAGHGLLNLLAAVRTALNGAEDPQVARVLAERRPEPLCSGLRRMSDADAAVARAFLVSVGCPDVPATAAGLRAAGLVTG